MTVAKPPPELLRRCEEVLSLRDSLERAYEMDGGTPLVLGAYIAAIKEMERCDAMIAEYHTQGGEAV